MHRLFFVLFSLIAFALWNTPGQASGDYGCAPTWTVDQREYGECTNSAILAPANDTRVNLLLLMHDFYPAGAGAQSTGEEPLFDWRSLKANLFSDSGKGTREQSRCATNAEGVVAFERAINIARDVSDDERNTLLSARRAFEALCATGMRSIPIRIVLSGIKSKTGNEFFEYLSGAMTFYDGDFVAAAKIFAGLNTAKNPWVRETAAYVLARNELNHAQENAFDEYGYYDPDGKIDSTTLAAAQTGFQNYLKNWPKGQYAGSARGLMRRVYWLGIDHVQMAAEYRWQLENRGGPESQADLTEEIDNKLLPRDNGGTFGDDPLLVAVEDLMRMRKSGGYFSKTIGKAEIEAQKAVFTKHPELHEYLLAAYAFYVENKPAEVLALIPDATRQPRMGYIQFTRQALRGLALDATKDRNARGFWEEMIPNASYPYQSPVAEMALAMNMERGNALGEVFASKSLVQDITVREMLMQHVASPAILRAQASDTKRHPHERDVALFTLLYKGLSRGRYGEFVADLNLTPKGAKTEGYFDELRTSQEIPVGLFKAGGKKGEFACPHVRDSVGILAKNAGDTQSKLCVADFFRVNGFDQNALDRQPDAKQLGGTKSLFPGAPYSRLEVYKSLIADPKVVAEHKAYALYRAVYCYAPGRSNSCGGKDVAVGQRKAWHDQLKRDYPQSQWAKKLRYFW
jgi:hypothetical protein